ncbi:MAG: HAD hydrolase-like protein [Gemmatimonadetes bacterium]|nr:HAD hydrolase-like protein [Gemmatimonadota bacterium]
MRKLVLFDIDGTLVSTRGAAWRAFRRALLEVYQETGPIEDYDFHGRTDPQIARELLRMGGLDDRAIDAGMARFWTAYLRELEAELALPDVTVDVLPGVPALLDSLHAGGEHLVALLTGNIVEGARLKLSAAGLWERFDFGAYGSDHERRDRLPAIAVKRARERSGIHFRGRDVVIIGDTPFDVECGRSLGVWAVAVATGKHSAAELREAGADVVLPDLSATGQAVAAIEALGQ